MIFVLGNSKFKEKYVCASVNNNNEIPEYQREVDTYSLHTEGIQSRLKVSY